jgi:hypothetical protein
MLNVKDKVSQLSPEERKVMRIVGRICGSPHKNFRKETIRKKANQKLQSQLNPTIKSLHSKGLIRYYRGRENLSTTALGFKVAQYLEKQYKKELYEDLRILLIFS